MSCEDVLEWVGAGVLKEYKNLAHNRMLQAGDRSVCHVGAGSDGEAVMDPAEAEGGEGLVDDDEGDEPAETAVCAFVADDLHKGSNREAGSPFSRVGRREKRRSPAKWAIRHCLFGSSSELILWAASAAKGGAPLSCTITGRARSTKPTRSHTRKHTEPRSVRQPTSGKPKWRTPRTRSPSS